VGKADGLLRLYIDNRGLNEVTRKVAYPFSRVDNTLAELKDATSLTYLDLVCGFLQVQDYVSDTLWSHGVGRHAVRTVQCFSCASSDGE
jgi:hypothetical protein